eukprot:CAMPEP_0119529492 /NCGR_PEP_ID=MMETSP1344-20130328/43495_1 /TAXON_ID=236787 /ORGANISM="Florenciella parvula, Strain CCMP2471" /LENGTH=38 /DNA_ID= /DNA_START= /DNA_END= /DNA_ORIENTATION=
MATGATDARSWACQDAPPHLPLALLTGELHGVLALKSL